MLKERMQKWIKDRKSPLLSEEIEYVKIQQLVAEGELVTGNDTDRFQQAYIEVCDKETEESIERENFAFLKEQLGYLKEHQDRFIYIESDWFELVGADSVSLEVDDLFGRYNVMLGLKVQKKHEKALRNFLEQQLHGSESKFGMLFSQQDGLWDINFTLDYVTGFNDDQSLDEAFRLIYHFLFMLAETIEDNK